MWREASPAKQPTLNFYTNYTLSSLGPLNKALSVSSDRLLMQRTLHDHTSCPGPARRLGGGSADSAGSALLAGVAMQCWRETVANKSKPVLTLMEQVADRLLRDKKRKVKFKHEVQTNKHRQTRHNESFPSCTGGSNPWLITFPFVHDVRLPGSELFQNKATLRFQGVGAIRITHMAAFLSDKYP